MEFNNIKTEISTKEVSALPSTNQDRISLKSTEKPTTNTITNAVKVEVVSTSYDTVAVSHDVRDLISSVGKDSVKRSLVSIYGKSGRLFSSAKDIETASIPLSEYPIKLEYELTTMVNGSEVEYKSSQLVNTSTPGVSYTSLVGKTTSSVRDVTIPEAISAIDEDILKIKNNLENFSFMYDKSENKVVPLQQLIINLSTKVDELTKSLENVKEKVKNL